jgi:hypothetical protein
MLQGVIVMLDTAWEVAGLGWYVEGWCARVVRCVVSISVSSLLGDV